MEARTGGHTEDTLNRPQSKCVVTVDYNAKVVCAHTEL